MVLLSAIYIVLIHLLITNVLRALCNKLDNVKKGVKRNVCIWNVSCGVKILIIYIYIK